MLNIDTSGNYIYFFVAIAAILITFFWILRYLLPYRMKARKTQGAIVKYLGLIEFGVWAFFLAYSFTKFFEQTSVFAVVVLVFLLFLIILFNWYYIKDYVSGVVFKHSSNVHINDSIRIGEYEGKIIRLGVRTMIIENKNGETITLPYSRIVQQPLHKINIAESIKSYTFELKVKKDSDIISTIQDIKEYILSLSWSSLKHTPGVKLLEENSDNYQFEITVFSLLDDYTYKTEQNLREKFGVE